MLRPLWTVRLGTPPRGLALARESGDVLAWDEQGLWLWNPAGEPQANARFPGSLTTAACSETGTAFAAGNAAGRVWRLARDLTPTWETHLPSPISAVGMDTFGQLLAVADRRGRLSGFDAAGACLRRWESPRPLTHLAFAPAVPLLLAAADFGLVLCLDLAGGGWRWRATPMNNLGSLAVGGEGEPVVLAGFTEGLLPFDREGHRGDGWKSVPPCRLAALGYDGRQLAAAGLDDQLWVSDSAGRFRSPHPLPAPAVGLVLAPLGDRVGVALADGSISLFEVLPG